MRVAYVAIHLENKIVQGGVGIKIQAQLSMWQQMGHQARFFLLSPNEVALPNTTSFEFHPTNQLPIVHMVSRELSRSNRLKKLIESVGAYQPDLIYLRYGLYAYPLHLIFQIAPVIIELNTHDIAEYRYRGSFFYTMNRLTRGILLSKASGFTPVSYEIGRLPSNRKYQKPMKVLANGIELSRITPYPAPINAQPVLVFSGSPGYDWHGVDKLFPLARRFPDLRLEIIGYRQEDSSRDLPANLHFWGFVKPEQARKILAQADSAIGTMALHRNRMAEASPLKVREYLACGVPTILGYQDTDFIGTKPEFLLQLPNCEENVAENAERIREFAYHMLGKRVDRRVILPLIDLKKKEEQRLAFFQELLKTKRRYNKFSSDEA